MAITIVYQLLSISFDNYLVFYVISGVIETKKKKKRNTRNCFADHFCCATIKM